LQGLFELTSLISRIFAEISLEVQLKRRARLCRYTKSGEFRLKIRDNGKKIVYYQESELCSEIAKQYAILKWGRVSFSSNAVITPNKA
jgi:predicted site-specific integrase-resolvase